MRCSLRYGCNSFMQSVLKLAEIHVEVMIWIGRFSSVRRCHLPNFKRLGRLLLVLEYPYSYPNWTSTEFSAHRRLVSVAGVRIVCLRIYMYI